MAASERGISPPMVDGRISGRTRDCNRVRTRGRIRTHVGTHVTCTCTYHINM
jgi:hypothetical protein